ncbi:MAG TPA: kelch repeat-containing protein [Polyangiales bacterium]
MRPRVSVFVTVCAALCAAGVFTFTPRAGAFSVANTPVTDSVRASFPKTTGWFRLVETLELRPGSDGRLVPDFSTLTHRRIRGADGAGRSLLPWFATSFGGFMRLQSGPSSLTRIEVQPIGARDVPARVERGVVVYPDAYLDTDVLYKATPTHTDEYFLLRSASAPHSFRFKIVRGPGAAQVRQAGNSIEIAGESGAAMLRATPPFAVDRAGHHATGTIRLVGSDELLVDMPLDGLTFPVLIDPDWASTGDMAYGRFYHGANVLPDGRVLITGGCSSSVCSGNLSLPACRSVVQAVEALSLETRTFSRVGESAVPRFFQVAESLSTGDVLVVGGCSTADCGSTVWAPEVYSATKNAFQPVSDPKGVARAGIVSVRLSDGRILLAGGCTRDSCNPRADLYDPASNHIVGAAPMHVARGRATAVLLGDGRVLVAGGCTNIDCAKTLAQAELYDPATNKWTETKPMAMPRGGHFASALGARRALVGGGCTSQDCASVLQSVEIFDESTLAFTATSALQQPRVGAVALPLPDGTVLINQGCGAGNVCDLSNEIFDPRTSAFTLSQQAITPRAFHAAVLHSSAHLVIANGGCQPTTCSWWNETWDISSLTSQDASVATLDASLPDGGQRRADAGPRPAFNPNDGCSCRVIARSTHTPVPWALLGLLALAAWGRARRRVRAACRHRAQRLGLLQLACVLSQLLIGCNQAAGTHTITVAADAATTDASIADGAVTGRPDASAADAATPCANVELAQLTSGWNHLHAIDTTGRGFSWGANNSGQLGVCDDKDRLRPTLLDSEHWTKLAGGARHGCGVQKDAQLFCWGENANGQLGLGDTTNSTMATLHVDTAHWSDAACGALHSCGLHEDGSLWCWGANSSGQLGLGPATAETHRAQQVGSETDWAHVYANARFSCALKVDGALYCWGDNTNGQLGVGDTSVHPTPQLVAAKLRFRDLATGALHACAITTSGALYCWGLGASGQLGLGERAQHTAPTRVGTASDWQAVACGSEHSCGIRAGALYCWGANAARQLGVGDMTDRALPTLVDDKRHWVQLAVGMSHSCALDDHGQVACFGDAARGQLGDATIKPRALPADVCISPP